MKRVLATGTFDIIHPGHIYFLEQARALGDELWVIVARDSNVRKHKPAPVISEQQRLAVVRALKTVDYAELGDDRDMLAPVERIQPEIVALGYDQYFDEEELQKRLDDRGINARVVRIEGKMDGELFSGERIRDIIRKRDEG
jgi:FAD synthetase